MLRKFLMISVICLQATVAFAASAPEPKERKPGEIIPMEERIFVPFEPMTLPIMTDQNDTYRVRILYSIEVFNDSDLERVKAKAPKVTGEILQALYPLLYQQINSHKTFLIKDIDIIGFNSFLQQITQKVLPSDLEHDIYIFQISARKL